MVVTSSNPVNWFLNMQVEEHYKITNLDDHII